MSNIYSSQKKKKNTGIPFDNEDIPQSDYFKYMKCT